MRKCYRVENNMVPPSLPTRTGPELRTDSPMTGFGEVASTVEKGVVREFCEGCGI